MIRLPFISRFIMSLAMLSY